MNIESDERRLGPPFVERSFIVREIVEPKMFFDALVTRVAKHHLI